MCQPWRPWNERDRQFDRFDIIWPHLFVVAMTQKAAVSEAKTRRAIKAAQAAGLTVKEVVVTVDCVRLVIHGDAESGSETLENNQILRPIQWE